MRITSISIVIKFTLQIRNGPGQFEIGHRQFHHLFDGFGKLAKFHFEGDSKIVTYTNKFVQTSFYKNSVAKKDIDPYILLAQPIPQFDLWQKAEQILKKNDNVNVNVLKFGQDYVSVTDVSKFYSFNRSNLATIKPIYLKIYGKRAKPSPSTSHPMPVLGTNHWITFEVEYGFTSAVMNVVLIKSAEETQLIKRIPLKKNYYMHSFGATKNYAVFLRCSIPHGPFLSHAICCGSGFIEMGTR